MKIKKIVLFMLTILIGFILVGCRGISKSDFEKAYKLVRPSIDTTVEVKGDFKVITKGYKNVDISWKVSNNDLATVGKEKDSEGNLTISVKRPEYVEGAAPKEFVLTATVTSGKFTREKTFTIKVAYKNPGLKVLKLEDILNPEKFDEFKQMAAQNPDAELKNVTVIGIGNEHFTVADDKGLAIVVWCNSKVNIPTNVKIGAKGDLENVIFTNNYGQFQFKAKNNVVPTFRILQENQQVVEKEYTVSQLDKLIDKKTPEEIEKLVNNGEHKRYIKVKGIVKLVNPSEENYRVVLLDHEVAEYNKVTFAVSYRAGMVYKELLNYEGVIVELYGIIYEMRTDDSNFGGKNSIRFNAYKMVVGELTDEQKVNIELNKVKNLTFENETTNILPKKGQFATLSYEFVDPTNPANQFIDLVNGNIKKADDLYEVKVKVTAKSGTVTKDKQIIITIGVPKNVITVSTLKSNEIIVDRTYYVSGVLFNKFKPNKDGIVNAYFLDKDASAGVILKIAKELIENIDINTEIKVIGKAIKNNDVYELKVTKVEKVSENIKVNIPEITTKEQLQTLTQKDISRVFNVNIPKFTVKKISGSTITLEVDGFEFTIYAKDVTLTIGQEITFEKALLDSYKGKLQFRYVNGFNTIKVVELEPVEKVKKDLALVQDIQMLEAGNLPLQELGQFGSQLTYKFKNENDPHKNLVNLVEKKCTIPTLGQVEVILVVKATVGEVSQEKEFKLTLGKPQVASSVSDVLANYVENNTYYFKGIVISLYHKNGKPSKAYVSDKNGLKAIILYGNKALLKDVEVGQEVTVNGKAKKSFGIPQIVEFEVTLGEKNQQVEVEVITTIDRLVAFNNADLSRMVSIKVPNLKVISKNKSELVVGIDGKQVTIYHSGNDLNVADLVGYENLIIDFYNEKLQFRFVNESKFVKPELTDEQKVDADLLVLPETVQIETDGPLGLNKKGVEGSNISYALKNADDPHKNLVNLEELTATIPVGEPVTVVIVATVSSGSIQKTKEITIKLGKLSLKSVKEIYDEGFVTNTKYYFKGIVTLVKENKNHNGRIYISDSDGLHSVYVTGNESFFTTIALKQEVEIVGYARFDEDIKIKYIEADQIIKKISENQNVSIQEYTEISQLETLNVGNHSRIIKINIPGLKVVTKGNDLVLKINDKNVLVYAKDNTLEVDDEVVFVEIFVEYFKDVLKYRVYDNSKILVKELNDSQKIEKIKELLLATYNNKTFEGETSTNLPLLKSHPRFGGTITYVQSEVDELVQDGKWKNVKLTKEIQAIIDVNGISDTVKLNITIKEKSTEVKTAVFDFSKIVSEMPELKGKGAGTIFSELDNNGKDLLSKTIVGDSELKIISVEQQKAYVGNGQGGGNYQNKLELIKMGTGSANGELTIKFNKQIKKITINAVAWPKKSDSIKVNDLDAKALNKTNPTDVVFDLSASPTDTISIKTMNRALIFKITFEF